MMRFNIPRSEVSELIDEWCCDEKYRQILKRRYLDNVKFEALAEEFDMSVTQIKRIVYKGQEKIFKHLK